MKGGKDAIMPPKRPDPQGDWLDVAFIIGQFEEALYVKASHTPGSAEACSLNNP
jgi:hypothetical protein